MRIAILSISQPAKQFCQKLKQTSSSYELQCIVEEASE